MNKKTKKEYKISVSAEQQKILAIMSNHKGMAKTLQKIVDCQIECFIRNLERIKEAQKNTFIQGPRTEEE